MAFLQNQISVFIMVVRSLINAEENRMPGLVDELLGKNAALTARKKREVKKAEINRANAKTSDAIRVRLAKYLPHCPVLYEVLCVANDYDVKSLNQNLAELVKNASIYLFKGSGQMVFGSAKNEYGKFNSRELLTEGNDFWVVEFLLWDEVEIYLLPFADARRNFVCQLMEKDDVYEKPIAYDLADRNLDVICTSDLRRSTALGLIDNYSGIFSKKSSRWHLYEGDFLSSSDYIKKMDKERERDSRIAQLEKLEEERDDARREFLEESMDDPEYSWVYNKEREDKENGRGLWFVP